MGKLVTGVESVCCSLALSCDLDVETVYVVVTITFETPVCDGEVPPCVCEIEASVWSSCVGLVTTLIGGGVRTWVENCVSTVVVGALARSDRLPLMSRYWAWTKFMCLSP